jgi:hypothetical protein
VACGPPSPVCRILTRDWDLLTRAQEAGIVRSDVGVAEVLGLLIGVSHAAEQGAWDTRMRQRTLRVIFDGLRR